jgi:hypothetical protein
VSSDSLGGELVMMPLTLYLVGSWKAAWSTLIVDRACTRVSHSSIGPFSARGAGRQRRGQSSPALRW